ncbi:TPA: hypothetical protein PWX29_001043, partial [Mannheimia haemolytica]|nr:hypothetical protein [Mannheimia haemolytica]HDL5282884.1 hypothetical protein [Mannheimia haemolytica]HDL6292585.1 hypothetical protein [Mannheimia haemolytica]HDZ3591302.1 hypothetical protein [Mannheimia haemolytica]
KGYDEFLAEKIRLGLEDMQSGNGLSLDESKARTKQLIERKARELANFEQENIIYG